MMNPLFQMFGNMSAGNNNFLQQFNQFRSSFQGDPKQKVQELLNSGQMTQEQFNQLSIMAQSFQNLLK